MAFQAITTLASGEWPGGMTFQWQPIDPWLQLTMVAVIAVIGILHLLFWRKSGKSRKGR